MIEMRVEPHRVPSRIMELRHASLPGHELISVGLEDLAAGRESVEALLLRSAAQRLASIGVTVPGGSLDDAPIRLYQVVVDEVGEGRAHSRYNALRRRLLSFIRAAATVDARTG